jgi:hypothetical protein
MFRRDKNADLKVARSFAIFLMFATLAVFWRVEAQDNNFAARARRLYWEAQSRRNKTPQDAEALWTFARACFDLGDFATNSSERAEIAEAGIAACRGVLARNPSSIEGHYYLGMNLGQLAQTKGLGALKLVDLMELEFKKARKLDETFDYAGPDRNLGLLYRDAPSIGSVGSRSKAKQHLARAVEIAPDYPENHLNLAETCLKWEDRNCATRELKALESEWSTARTNFVGVEWDQSWVDWKKRLQAVKRKVEEHSKAIQAPHHN